MTLLLDSANLEDAARAAGLGFVQGITTNPTLLKRAGSDPLRQAEKLLRSAPWREVYYQPTGAYGSLQQEAEQAWDLDRERIVLKLPATPDGLAIAGTMVRLGAKVALTAVQSPQGMAVAESAGCVAVIPYLDRALRDIRTDALLLQSLAKIRRGKTRIVVASVKNVGQVLSAFYDGADAVTAPLAVLEGLLTHPASLEAERDFLQEYRSR
jgi:transaldolase